MTDPSLRFLLARPLGGFNDIMCQFELAWRYARQFGRTLVVDAEGGGLKDDLFRYYRLRGGFAGQIRSMSEMGWTVSATDGVIAGVDANGQSLFERTWREMHGFDRKIDHPDRVLVHATPGGGDLGVHFLEKLSLQDWVRDHLRDSIAPLGTQYTSIHIRNTDMQTEYVTAFRAAAGKFLNRTVLVCSDDSNAIQYFRETYGDRCDFRTTSSLRNTDGTALHLRENRDVLQTNLGLLTDLYALASAARICMVDTRGTKRSGFAVLAAHILRRMAPVGGTDAFDLGSRGPTYLRALSRGRLFRVYRVRNVESRYFCHPTYE